MQLTRSAAAKTFEHTLDRGARSDFSQILTAHAIGHREQPAVGASLLGRIRRDVTQKIFVVAAHASGIGKLGEFEL